MWDAVSNDVPHADFVTEQSGQRRLFGFELKDIEFQFQVCMWEEKLAWFCEWIWKSQFSFIHSSKSSSKNINSQSLIILFSVEEMKEIIEGAAFNGQKMKRRDLIVFVVFLDF